MSFSSRIKEDLSRIRLRSAEEKKAELSGMLFGCGALYLGNRVRGVTCTTENPEVGRRIAVLATDLYGMNPQMESMEVQGRKHPLFVVYMIGESATRLQEETGFLFRGEDGFLLSETHPGYSDGSEGAKAFLRGLFLGCGSCTNPKVGYQLELNVRTHVMAEGIQEQLSVYGIDSRIRNRNGKPVLYVSGENVTAFLALIGANAAAMELENVRVEKDLRNYVNRKSNCETANIGKTVTAGLVQLRAIEEIETTVGLRRLPAPLYEAAMLRINHPDATLQELADLAEIGKSGMNHRLTRLIQMAQELRNE